MGPCPPTQSLCFMGISPRVQSTNMWGISRVPMFGIVILVWENTMSLGAWTLRVRLGVLPTASARSYQMNPDRRVIDCYIYHTLLYMDD